jgi:hypothetical protein
MTPSFGKPPSAPATSSRVFDEMDEHQVVVSPYAPALRAAHLVQMTAEVKERVDRFAARRADGALAGC